METKQSVSEANKEFYNLVANGYGRVAPGRRKAMPWLENIIKLLSQATKGGTFLDIGAGAGYVSLIAAKYFRDVVAYDASQRMLNQILNSDITTIVGQADNINYSDNHFDAVCTFAVLHHLEKHSKVFREIHRVLKPGGIYYSDHDIESHFVKRTWPLLKIYRAIQDPAAKFARINPRARMLYDVAEHWKNGIDSDKVGIVLTNIGFKVYITYHWQGLLPIQREFRKGCAPLMRVVAVKK